MFLQDKREHCHSRRDSDVGLPSIETNSTGSGVASKSSIALKNDTNMSLHVLCVHSCVEIECVRAKDPFKGGLWCAQ